MNKANNSILKQRILNLLAECMKDQKVDLWLIYTRESSRDPLSIDVGLDRAVARTAGLFFFENGTLRRIALAASYDTTPIEESGIYDEIIPFRQEGIAPHLKEQIEALNPQKIALNYSRDIAVADGLSFGMREHLIEILGPDILDRIVSSEPLVTSFRCRKLPEELEKICSSVKLTQDILDRALSTDKVHPGETREIDLGNFLESETRHAGAEVAFAHVTVGPCRGHAEPTDRMIKPGDLVRIDFGIFVEGYCSDIQRTAYILKPGQTAPPKAVSQLFETTLKACHAGIEALVPGNKGRQVDEIARKVITDGGYEEYPHATGHAIGLEPHELGPVLGPPWKERYGTSVEHQLAPGMVFAVEPAAYVDIPECGGIVQVGIEEDVIVTEGKPQIIGTPQTELILIPTL